MDLDVVGILSDLVSPLIQRGYDFMIVETAVFSIFASCWLRRRGNTLTLAHKIWRNLVGRHSEDMSHHALYHEI